MSPGPQQRQRTGRGEHPLRSQQRLIESGFEQKLLMPQTPWSTPTLEHDPTTFLLKSCDTLDRKHQGFFTEKQRISADRFGYPICIGSLFQLHIDIALPSSICRALLGAERFLDSRNSSSHQSMMEANPGVARCHGVALWSQQSKQGPKEGKRSRIPTGTHNGRDFMVNGQSVNRFAMSMKVISMKHG